MWQRVNRILAVIVLLLSVGAAARLGFTYWSTHVMQTTKTVIGTPTTAGNAPANTKIKIGNFKYYTASDFLKRPTLVVSYEMSNGSAVGALPQYVFDNTVSFVQVTTAGTNSILAATTVPKAKLSFLNQNYQENGEITLKKGQTARVLATYRLESQARPVTMLVNGKKRMTLQPWTMKEVAGQ